MPSRELKAAGPSLGARARPSESQGQRALSLRGWEETGLHLLGSDPDLQKEKEEVGCQQSLRFLGNEIISRLISACQPRDQCLLSHLLISTCSAQ